MARYDQTLEDRITALGILIEHHEHLLETLPKNLEYKREGLKVRLSEFYLEYKERTGRDYNLFAQSRETSNTK